MDETIIFDDDMGLNSLIDSLQNNIFETIVKKSSDDSMLSTFLATMMLKNFNEMEQLKSAKTYHRQILLEKTGCDTKEYFSWDFSNMLEVIKG